MASQFRLHRSRSANRSEARVKLVVSLAATSLAGVAFGQSGVLRSIDSVEESAKPDKIAAKRQTSIANPLQPSGFGGPPPKHSDEAPEKPTKEKSKQLEIVKAGRFWFPDKNDRNVFEITGPVHCRTQGYDIYADYVTGNLKTKIYILKGNAKLVSDQGVIVGQYIEADLANEHYKAQDSEADLRPSLLKGQVKDDVYIKARKTEGDKEKVVSENGYLTTCNRDDPHFELAAERVEITPYDEAVLHRVKIVALNRTLIGLPRLTIPLQEGADRYLPDVGESTEEGYYIKTRYGIDIGKKDGFDARLDYMSRLGAGIGGDYKYKTDKRKGRIQLYGVTGGQNYFEYSVSHTQTFGKNVFALDSSLQNRHYLNAPTSSLLNVRTYYRVLQDKSTSQISFYQTNNESSNSNSTSRTLGFSNSQSFLRLFRSNLNIDWVASENQYGTNAKTERQQVNVRLNAQRDLKKANAILEYQRTIPVGETINFVNAADRTPVLTLQSSNTKLLGKKSFLPFQTELSIGEFSDTTSKKQITRESFLFTFGNGSSGRFDSGYSSAMDYSSSYNSSYSMSSGGTAAGMQGSPGSNRSMVSGADSVQTGSSPSPLNISYNGKFKQGIYSDDTAQYTTGLNTTASYRVGTNLSMNLRYNYLDSHGYSPLSIDRQGRSNISTLDLDTRLARNLTLSAGTGYDFFQDSKFGQSKWQMVNMRTEWAPAEWFQFRTYSTYDTTQEKLSNVRFDVGYKPGATFVGIGAKYDGIRHTWGNLSVFVDGLKMGRLKLSTLLIYNGYLKKFESRHFSFTYDLHCAEAIFQVLDNPTGYRPGTQFVFMIRLKAFPFNTPFGTGRTGQSLGLGYGRGGY